MDINFVFGIEGRAAVAKKAEDLELQLRDGNCDGNCRHRHGGIATLNDTSGRYLNGDRDCRSTNSGGEQ